MTALYALAFLIIGPSSESRCLCTYKAFMDAHAHDASGQSMKLMGGHNTAASHLSQHDLVAARAKCSAKFCSSVTRS